MNLVFIHGPAAAGKYTVGKHLADRTGYRLFHNHLVVNAITPVFDFGSKEFISLRESMWISVFREAAKKEQSLIFTFAPERTVTDSFVPTATRTIEAAGGKVLFVRLVCAVSQLEKRIVNESRGQFGKLRSLEMFRELSQAGAFEYPSLPDSGLTIDTNLIPAPEAAVQISNFFDLPVS